jgi:hypothetical protein
VRDVDGGGSEDCVDYEENPEWQVFGGRIGLIHGGRRSGEKCVRRGAGMLKAERQFGQNGCGEFRTGRFGVRSGDAGGASVYVSGDQLVRRRNWPS